MVLGKVVGTVVSTRKHSNLVGYKLLLIKPVYGKKEDVMIAADWLGAGIGELVLITKGQPTQYGIDKSAPIDALVVGIVDSEPQLLD